MKNSLGSILFLLIFTLLYGEDFTHDIKIDNQNPYVKEGIVLSLELNQTNPDIVLLFNFDIKKSKDYEFRRLNSIEQDTYHNAYLKYIYLVYPLKEGHIEIEFNLLKKVTTDESITYSYSGDRDNVKTLVTKDTPITLPVLSLDVKSLPKDTLLVGDFRLTHTIKKHKAKAYEPISFNITLKGRGYPPLLDRVLQKEGEFTRFTEKPIVHSKAEIEGIENQVIYPIALSHKENFTLSPIILKAFNPKTDKSYELTIPQQQFQIEKVAIENLIDKKNTPVVTEQDFSWLKEFFSYLFVFIAGYFTATNLTSYRKKSNKKPISLALKIKACKDKKSLFRLLVSSNNREFTSTIERLEGALYRDENIDFERIKRRLIEV